MIFQKYKNVFRLVNIPNLTEKNMIKNYISLFKACLLFNQRYIKETQSIINSLIKK